MGNTLFNYKDVRNSVSRSGFDLSKRVLFTSKVGELLPVYCKPVMPGDKFHINLQSFTRTQPVQSSAFTRIKEYVDFFYVPYHLLWRNFQSSFTQISESSNFALSPSENLPISDKLPYISQDVLFSALSPALGSSDIVGADALLQSCKLLAYLGYFDLTPYIKSGTDIDDVIDKVPHVNVNLMPLLAYQKVYYDFYRNDRWEKNNAKAFNVDYLTSDMNMFSYSSQLYNSGMLTLRYANFAKDLFFGLLPSAQYGDTSVVTQSITGQGKLPVGSNLGDLPLWHGNTSGVSTRPTNPQVNTTTGEHLFVAGTTGASEQLHTPVVTTKEASVQLKAVENELNILQLRQATAMQKWKEITQCGDFNYRSQVEKHFGVKLPELMAHRATYVGGSQGIISINEVVNQNLENSEPSIKGKGTGSISDGNFTFESKDHGILLGIYYAIPFVDYAISGTRRDVSIVNISDLPIPEFDRLGFEPMSIRELFNITEGSYVGFAGYAPRFYNWKTDIDEVKGAFRSSLPNWVAQYDADYIKSLVDRGEFLPCIKVNASILDDIFAMQAFNYTAQTGPCDTDQLLNCINFDVKAVRNLDYSGVPY